MKEKNGNCNTWPKQCIRMHCLGLWYVFFLFYKGFYFIFLCPLMFFLTSYLTLVHLPSPTMTLGEPKQYVKMHCLGLRYVFFLINFLFFNFNFFLFFWFNSTQHTYFHPQWPQMTSKGPNQHVETHHLSLKYVFFNIFYISCPFLCVEYY